MGGAIPSANVDKSGGVSPGRENGSDAVSWLSARGVIPIANVAKSVDWGSTTGVSGVAELEEIAEVVSRCFVLIALFLERVFLLLALRRAKNSGSFFLSA